jgi:hypothetical protein
MIVIILGFIFTEIIVNVSHQHHLDGCVTCIFFLIKIDLKVINKGFVINDSYITRVLA